MWKNWLPFVFIITTGAATAVRLTCCPHANVCVLGLVPPQPCICENQYFNTAEFPVAASDSSFNLTSIAILWLWDDTWVFVVCSLIAAVKVVWRWWFIHEGSWTLCYEFHLFTLTCTTQNKLSISKPCNTTGWPCSEGGALLTFTSWMTHRIVLIDFRIFFFLKHKQLQIFTWCDFVIHLFSSRPKGRNIVCHVAVSWPIFTCRIITVWLYGKRISQERLKERKLIIF